MKNNTTTDAKFTSFDNTDNWVHGIVGDYHFQAKLFDEKSTFGIKKGRVSKLSIWNDGLRFKEQDFFKACIMNYDRGWDIKPKREFIPLFDSVMALLENSPKRFEITEPKN